MLNSLFIQNYRNLHSLKIKSLGKVNLIIGKNNTGKSTILEAIALYASKDHLRTISQFLSDRGEGFKPTVSDNNLTEININTLSSLFTNRIAGFEKENEIIIGALDETNLGEDLSTEKYLSIRIARYYNETVKDSNGSITSKRTIIEQYNDSDNIDLEFGLNIRTADNSYMFGLDNDLYRNPASIRNNKEHFQFISTRNVDREINSKLFDNIALTDKEGFVIDALKIIESETERIAFIDDNLNLRTAVIKLSNSKDILPLRSMGDGINRILTIILALVNCEEGYLLIDEFENGLHYTVQEQLWRVIFSLSEKLNIQVFATTHSEDCIFSFESVLNSKNNTVLGKLIRLDNINGSIKQVEFDEQELRIATEHNIETR